MSYKEYAGVLDAKGMKFGLVVSRFNDFLTGQLVKGALDCLVRHGAKESDIAVAWVPRPYATCSAMSISRPRPRSCARSRGG